MPKTTFEVENLILRSLSNLLWRVHATTWAGRQAASELILGWARFPFSNSFYWKFGQFTHTIDRASEWTVTMMPPFPLILPRLQIVAGHLIPRDFAPWLCFTLCAWDESTSTFAFCRLKLLPKSFPLPLTNSKQGSTDWPEQPDHGFYWTTSISRSPFLRRRGME